MVNNKEKPVSAPGQWKRKLSLLVLAAALIAAGYGLWKHPQMMTQLQQMFSEAAADGSAQYQLPENNDMLGKIEALTQQVQSLQQEMAQLRAQTDNQPQDTGDLREKMAALEKHNLNIIDSKADVATVLGLITRMDKAEAKLDRLGKVTDSGALNLTAVMLVKDSAERGGSFEYELEVLKQIADNAMKPELAELQKSARLGIVPAAQLKAEFNSLYAPLLAQLKQNAEQSWKDRLNSKLNEIVQIKRLDQVTPSDAEAQELDLAREAAAAGNLASAAEILRRPQLANLLKDARLQKWLEATEANLAFHQAIDKLTAQSLALLKVNILKAQKTQP